MNKAIVQSENQFRRPGTLLVARSVGWVTFWEVVGDKILYNAALGCALLLSLGVLASRLTFIQPERVILDFGLFAVNLSCTAISILMGSSLIVREFERRTVYVALSRPISRFQFILGKFFGIGVVLTVNWLIFVTGYVIILAGFATSEFFVLFNWTLVAALIFILVQTFVLASIAILFSSVSTTSLAVMITMGFYLIGNNISELKFVARTSSPLVRAVLNGAAVILPNFEHFNLGTRVTYGLPLSQATIFQTLLYGGLISALFLILGGLLIRSREL